MDNNERSRLIVEKAKRILRKGEYMPMRLYDWLVSYSPETIPDRFDLVGYNELILSEKYRQEKAYFDNMFRDVDPSIKIDYEQAKAILADEYYSLVLAGAGTGKTTTMVGKVKYLVEKENVKPERILVLSFSRKAVNELRTRINIDFKLPAEVTTFHSLGYKYIREKFEGRFCRPVDDNFKHKTIVEWLQKAIFSSKKNMEQFVRTMSSINSAHYSGLIGRHLKENAGNYNNFDEYFESYVEMKLSEVTIPEIGILGRDKMSLAVRLNGIAKNRMNSESPRTLRGEHVKSKGEAEIANWLFRHGIDYRYEETVGELMEDNRIYNPDFTIDCGGEPIYVEYYGLSDVNKSEHIELVRYEEIRKKKTEWHKQHGTKHIDLDNKYGASYIKDLEKALIRYGFNIKESNQIEVYRAVLKQNPAAELYKVEKFLLDMVKIIKTSQREDYRELLENEVKKFPDYEQLEAERIVEYLLGFYDFYEYKKQNGKYLWLDFEDMLISANKIIANTENLSRDYDYIIIDEYQDISKSRYEMAKRVSLTNGARVIAVGDDWQTIYSFAGSRIEYVYDFNKYFEHSKSFTITQTYRNAQELIDAAGEFVMRNSMQIKKKLKSVKREQGAIKFRSYIYQKKSQDKEFYALHDLIVELAAKNPGDSIMVLTRRNSYINKAFGVVSEIHKGLRLFRPEAFNRASIGDIGGDKIEFDFMTMHKSKGLTADWVILTDIDKNFPMKGDDFWIEKLFRGAPIEEPISDAEERRLFYVGLTRTRHKVYILHSDNLKYTSPFVKELMDIVENRENSHKRP